MNLVRLGHYFNPVGGADNEGRAHGSCRTALVVAVTPGAIPGSLQPPTADQVNLAVWNHGGGQEIRRDVIVGPPNEQGESFHLAADCPWKR